MLGAVGGVLQSSPAHDAGLDAGCNSERRDAVLRTISARRTGSF